jgi:Uma2 family endonuclease
MTLSTTRMTAAEFLELPEDPDKVRYELVHGEVTVSPSPNLEHGYASARLLTLLTNHVVEHDLGCVIADIDTHFTDEDVRRPDIFYFTRARMGVMGDKYVEQPPDLCVEILSPSNPLSDLEDKFKLYQDCGVPAYWIVDPAKRRIDGFVLLAGAYKPAGKGKGSDVVRLPPFPDLDIPLATLWLPKPPKPRTRPN